MAEALAVIGVVASIIQLVDFSTKVSKHLNDFLDNNNEVPGMFKEVKLQLPLLVETLHRTQFHVDHGHYDGQVEAALQALLEGCNAQMTLLDKILTKATQKGHDSNITKGRKAFYSLRHEKLVTKINMKLSTYVEKLVLFQCTVGPDHIVSTMKEILGRENEFQRPEEMILGTNKLDTFQSEYKGLHKGVERSKKAATGYISTFDHRRRHFRAFIVLTRVNIPWCLKASLELTWGNGRYSIAPALELERIVKYTSPGYEIFWKCEMRILDLPSGLVQLDRLFRAGRASPLDIDPGGATWLEKLLHKPLEANYEVRVAFLKKLMEWGAPLNTNKSLMSLCANWTGMGPHMALLKEILALSSNVLEDSRHDTKHWPLPLPIWEMIPQANEIPDPFLLQFFRECSKNAFGFCDQTPLMDAILCGSTDEVIRYLQNTQSLVGKNLRGQSAVHFAAALGTTELQLLLNTGVGLDMQDNQGRSPLDYAAAYGCTQSVVSLLEAGAHPMRKNEDGSIHISFFGYAAVWDHWEVITQAFSFLQASTCYSARFLSSELDHLMATVGDDGFTERSKGMEYLFELGADPNLVLQNGDSLLHRVRSLAEIKVLLKAGIKNIDSPDSQLASPLMLLLKSHGLDLYKLLLERGANTNHEDRYGHSALHIMCHIIQSHKRYNEPNALGMQSNAIIKTISLLRYGADPLKHDDCLCACSYYGCSASTVLAGPGDTGSEGDIWCLEWLLMIKEHRGTEIAQRALMDLVRVKEFDRIGMTHVCCNRQTSRSHFLCPMEDEEVYEILEEERFLKQALEDFMEEFSKSHGDSIEESWIGLLSRYFRLPEQQPSEKWTWGIWDGEGSIRCWNNESPPPWHLLSVAEKPGASGIARPLQLAPHRYYIDELTDTFREDCGSETLSTFSYCELYRIWVKHFIDEKSTAHIATSLVEPSWYEKRMYWAARQTFVLEAVRRKEIEIGDGSIKEME